MAMIESATNSDRPALILDIDGVFNIWASPDQPVPKHLQQRPDDLDLGVYYDPAHGAWLRRMHQTLADVYYISDLQEESHDQLSQVHDLPEFDWINIDPYVSRVHTYSAARALAITALFGNRPVAWLDDIITDTMFKWADTRSAEGAPTLVVKTEMNTGLLPEHMITVETWLANPAHP